MTTLLLSSRHTEDNQQLWRAAIQRGWSVERARGLTVPEIDDRNIVLYIESLYAPTIAQKLGLQLLEPPFDWLPKLPEEFRRRSVVLTTLADVAANSFPLFMKPPNEKSFAAKVYPSADSLPADYDPSTPVLISEPVDWTIELRCFCLDGVVRTLSPYIRNKQLSQLDGFSAGEDELAEARYFAESVLHNCRSNTPRAIVLDVGIIKGGWAVVEANAAWGSGIYGCDASEVLSVIECAVLNRNEHTN
jgi:hypothetical protein